MASTLIQNDVDLDFKSKSKKSNTTKDLKYITPSSGSNTPKVKSDYKSNSSLKLPDINTYSKNTPQIVKSKFAQYNSSPYDI